jgi:pyruvate,orthophosphate dikinase
VRRYIERVADEGLEHPRDYTIGTMIELPRACFLADHIAEHADFFSFGTNDLTPDRPRASARRHRGQHPRALHRDEDLRPLAVRDDRRARRRADAAHGRLAGPQDASPDITLGVCGEHGGDPDSIDFFHHSGIDYVSCSPVPRPIARVAAAQRLFRSGRLTTRTPSLPQSGDGPARPPGPVAVP